MMRKSFWLFKKKGNSHLIHLFEDTMLIRRHGHQNLEITVWVSEGGNKHDKSSGFRGYLAHPLSPSPKNRKSPNPKFLIFQEIELWTLRLKNVLYIWKYNPSFFSPSSKIKNKSSPRKFLIVQETETLKKLLFSQKKAFLIFQETGTLKNFLYFRK